MILFHKCLWGRSLKELLSSHSFFVTSWKDPSNVGDVHITSGFRFRLLNFIVMVCVFSPDSFRLNITHTHRPHHPPSPPPQWQSIFQAISMNHYATSFRAFKLTVLGTLFPPLLFLLHPSSYLFPKYSCFELPILLHSSLVNFVWNCLERIRMCVSGVG